MKYGARQTFSASCESYGNSSAFGVLARSTAGTLRGLHLQLRHTQGKLIRVIEGEIYDVAVDVRRGSPTFGQWVGVTLTADNFKQIYIPPGFAHGFLVLSESADFLYKTTAYYQPAAEHALRWDDPDLAIAWPTDGGVPQLSAKDGQAPAWRDAVTFD